MKYKIKPRGRYRFLYLYLIVLFGVLIISIFLVKVSEIDNYLRQTTDTIIGDAKQISEKSYIEGKKKEPVYFTLPGAEPVRALVEDYTKPNSLWTLVNKLNSLPENYEPSGLTVPNVTKAYSIAVREDIVEPIESMFAAASSEGVSLILASGYRSYETQNKLFNDAARSVGYQRANESIALPGQSEHQTGLSVDLAASNNNCYITSCFADTNGGIWLAKNAHRFGFTLRYPENKEQITGYIFEPWHFRFVGIDLATALYISDLTLEEAYTHLETSLATLVQNGAL